MRIGGPLGVCASARPAEPASVASSAASSVKRRDTGDLFMALSPCWKGSVRVFRGRQAQGSSDLVVVFAQRRRRPHVERTLAVEGHRRAHGAEQAHHRVLGRGRELQVHAPAGRAALRWCRTSARAARPRRCSRAHHSSRVRCLKRSPSSSISVSWFAMRLLARGEARVLEQIGLLDRRRQALPELLGRGHVQRDPFAVGAFEHVGLRHARPAVRAHHFVDLEEVREGVEVEMRHRLQHRDLDRAARAGAAALEQRTHHAVGGVEAGQRIGDRRADDTRVLRVDQQVQEAAGGLRDGVVGRPRSRPGRWRRSR